MGWLLIYIKKKTMASKETKRHGSKQSKCRGRKKNKQQLSPPLNLHKAPDFLFTFTKYL